MYRLLSPSLGVKWSIEYFKGGKPKTRKVFGELMLGK